MKAEAEEENHVTFKPGNGLKQKSDHPTCQDADSLVEWPNRPRPPVFGKFGILAPSSLRNQERDGTQYLSLRSAQCCLKGN